MGNYIKKEIGITLIALVITIIVMLILVTVTIRVATNGALFQHAANAAKGTKTAIVEENAILDGSVGDKSIEEIVAEATGNITYTAYEVGDTIRIAEQNFYVIEDSDEHTNTVKLLAALNVETDSNSANYNKQSESASTVAFDSTEPYTNDYDAESNPPTIKGLVDSYVSSLEITGAQGRLMSDAEADKISHYAFIDIDEADAFWIVDQSLIGNGAAYMYGDQFDMVFGGDDVYCDIYGLRPVIIVPKANIPAQD